MMLYPITRFCSVFALLAACGSSEKKTEPVAEHQPKILEGDEVPIRHHARTPEIGGDDDSGEMQVEGLKGHLDPYDIQTGVAPHSQALAQCFQLEAKKHIFLGGAVVLSFTVARDGSVKSVRASKSDVGSWAVESCLLEEGLQMSFKKPKGGEADFSLPLDFEARRAANWWTEEKAEEEVEPHSKDLRSCAREASARNPRNVWVTLYLGNRGVVQSVGFASPHVKGIDPKWVECAAAKVSAWTLNDPRGKIAKLGFRYNPE